MRGVSLLYTSPSSQELAAAIYARPRSGTARTTAKFPPQHGPPPTLRKEPHYFPILLQFVVDNPTGRSSIVSRYGNEQLVQLLSIENRRTLVGKLQRDELGEVFQ